MVTVGNTPLFRLERLREPGSADIFVKWEGANPTGSMKERMALSRIEGAEASMRTLRRLPLTKWDVRGGAV